MPTKTNVHGDALCFVVKTWARHKTTETVLNSCWWLAAVVGGWWCLAVGGWWSVGAFLNQTKLWVLKDSPGAGAGVRGRGQRQSVTCNARHTHGLVRMLGLVQQVQAPPVVRIRPPQDVHPRLRWTSREAEGIEPPQPRGQRRQEVRPGLRWSGRGQPQRRLRIPRAERQILRSCKLLSDHMGNASLGGGQGCVRREAQSSFTLHQFLCSVGYATDNCR